MTIEDLKRNNLIILECISGSKAYGLDIPCSDTDIKGVFILPKSEFYSLNYIPQISNPSNDIVYYELGRFIDLLAVNNPNILELLNTPPDSVLYEHPYIIPIKSAHVISKKCKDTFGKFAISQIKKAKGLNKKISNPMDIVRKGIESFCYVNYLNGSIPLVNYLGLKTWKQEDCGLVKIANMKNVFGLYHGSQLGFNGIAKNKYSNELSLSSIPNNIKQQCLLYFNSEGFTKYCKDHKEYWDWVKNRNETRYENTINHGRNYDSKNMMHTFRLLEMAIEIATEKRLNVRRKDREFLLSIRKGKFEYDELLLLAEKKQHQMEAAFNDSNLREVPDQEMLKKLSITIREQFYSE